LAYIADSKWFFIIKLELFIDLNIGY
jgi:hypothetical protein